MSTPTFDPSYFKDPLTGKFRFPAYTTDWKGLVQIRDLTDYSKQCFRHLSEDAVAHFDLKQFESAHIDFRFEVETLNQFILRFPLSCFSKGVTRSTLKSLFVVHDDFISQRGKYKEDDVVPYTLEEMEGPLKLGLMTLADTTGKLEKYWSGYTGEELEEIGLKHNILPAGTKKKTIQRMVDNNIPLPQLPMQPTILLRQVFADFFNLYIQDIKKHTAHFHPRILKALWLKIGEDNTYSDIQAIVKKILKAPYWINGNARMDEYTIDPASLSNAVFIFQPPLPSRELVFIKRSIDPNRIDWKDTYLKAKEGTFEKSYFVSGGRFCFPDYSDNASALVFVGDRTKYKKQYFTGLSSEEMHNFSLDDLERNFVQPEWEVREFSDFLEDLPKQYLKEGISGERLKQYFFDCYSLLDREEENPEIPHVTMSADDPFVKNGYYELSDQEKFSRVHSWDKMPEATLAKISLQHGIKPAKNKITLIWELINKDIPFPLAWYHPTEELIHYFHVLYDMYIDDIKKNTDHFHPLYFESLWLHVMDINSYRYIHDKVVDILADPYWSDRLYEARR